jgi:hypothetical protein
MRRWYLASGHAVLERVDCEVLVIDGFGIVSHKRGTGDRGRIAAPKGAA